MSETRKIYAIEDALQFGSVNHSIGSGDGWGMCKEQGRNQRELRIRAYWEFFVHGEQLQSGPFLQGGGCASQNF